MKRRKKIHTKLYLLHPWMRGLLVGLVIGLIIDLILISTIEFTNKNIFIIPLVIIISAIAGAIATKNRKNFLITHSS